MSLADRFTLKQVDFIVLPFTLNLVCYRKSTELKYSIIES